MTTPIIFQREALYEQVWQVPMSKLATQYNLSDVGLKKICKRLKVPTPPRGYWARLQNGYKDKQAKLPKLKDGLPDSYTHHPHRVSLPKSSNTPEVIALIQKIPSPISISKRLSNPHPLVQNVLPYLLKRKPDDNDKVSSSKIAIFVAHTRVRRALRIMDTMLKSFEKMGLDVIQDDKRDSITCVRIFNEDIAFLIDEKLDRSNHIPTPEEEKRREQYEFTHIPKYDYIPCGRLSLRITNYIPERCRKSRNERLNGKLIEDLIPDFFVDLIWAAWLKHQWRQKLEQEEIKREEIRRLRVEEELRRQGEAKRVEDLALQANNWSKSNQIRSYIKAVKTRATTQSLTLDDQRQLQEWLAWAQKQADKLDPLASSVPVFLQNQTQLEAFP